MRLLWNPSRLLIACLLVGPLTVLPATPLAADELPTGATLTIVAAPVQIAQAGAPDFVDAAPGQLVSAGDIVKTGSGGVAVLTFFDGSETQVASDSQIQVERANYDPAPDIAIMQTAGVTLNRVIPLPPGGNFETDTPTAIGLVRGTSYSISVSPAAAATTPSDGSDATDASTGIDAPDQAPAVTSAVLLTDRDGHVGHVQVYPTGMQDVLDLTGAGDVAATTGSQAAATHLPATALAEMELAATDLHNAEGAAQAAEHARSMSHALAAQLVAHGSTRARAANAATPANPATPADPATPANPATPGNSATPADPATPANPAMPANAATPADPATPGNSATPANPATPASPATPANPATGANSARATSVTQTSGSSTSGTASKPTSQGSTSNKTPRT